MAGSLVLAVSLGVAAQTPAAAAASSPLEQAVQAQLQQLREDPLLNGREQQRRLRLKDDGEREKRRDNTPEGWLRFVRWISEAGRVLVWVLGAAAAVLLLLGLRRWARWHADTQTAPALHLPSHVRNLDIRPDSLPEDIGAAALALWQQGDSRAAMSLLYRGLLSRLVHAHRVPIREASTEGECLQLAREHLAALPAAYAGRLVQAWQWTVYGARPPADDSFRALCEGFDGALSPPVQEGGA